jgi:hypothetical protein
MVRREQRAVFRDRKDLLQVRRSHFDARETRTLLEKVREVQALRIMKEPTDDLTRIELVDLAQAAAEVA